MRCGGFLVFLSIFLIGCENNSSANNNQLLIKQVENNANTPPPTPFKRPENTEILGVDEKIDRNFHESRNRRKSKIISVTTELTSLDSNFINKIPSVETQKKREKEIFKLVNSLAENSSDLVTLAKICRIMEIHGRGLNKWVSPYDIAFFLSVKILATKYKEDQIVKNELEGLKKYNIDGHLGEEFMLALEGKNPSFLFSEESELEFRGKN
jgi:hypothetical protein